MPMTIDMQRAWRTRLQMARDPGLLAVLGAVLLMCAPAFPGLSRLVVLPALLLAPGYALLRLLGQATGVRSVSVVVPLSLVLAVCASLVLDASGIRLGPLSLGLLLGAVTALLLAASYGRQLTASPLRPHRSTPPGRAEVVRLCEHSEVRDLLAYLRLIADPEDELSLRRVLNVPRRRIDDRAEKAVAAMARWDRTSFAAALGRPGDVPGLSPDAIRAIETFNNLLAGLRADAEAGLPVADMAEAVLERSGYVAELEASSDPRDASRIENLKELVAVARKFDARRERPGPQDPQTPGPQTPGALAVFLEQVPLSEDDLSP